jgi:hypothetical protein
VEDGNQERLKAAMQESFNADPLKFWRIYVAPLIPKDARLEIANPEPVTIKWESLLAKFPLMPAALPQARN